MMETTQTISTWAQKTFGSRVSPFEIAVRANVEVAEMISAISNDADPAFIGGEIADIAIIVCQIEPAVTGEYDFDALEYLTARVSPDDPESLAISVSLEMSKLMRLIAEYDSYEDTIIEMMQLLATIARRYGIDERAAIDEKMEINRSREWGRSEGGRFQHI